MAARGFNYQLPAHKIGYAEVRLENLKVSAFAQRNFESARAKKMVKEFIYEAVSTIVVSQRTDGSVYIVDGQHRVYACMQRGIETLVAEVRYGLTEQEEAMLFLLKNKESRNPNSRSEYKVALTAGISEFVETEAVLSKLGLRVSSNSKGGVGAVTTIVDITQKYGPEVLERTLTVAEEAWGREAGTWAAALLAGLGMFLGRHGDGVDDEQLAKRLEKKNAAKWLADVSMRCTSGGGGGGVRTRVFYELIVDEWNKRRTKNRIEK